MTDCNCKICTGAMADSLIEAQERCPECEGPLTYGASHRGEVVRLYADDRPGHLVHLGCTGDVRHIRTWVFPRDAL